MPDRDASRRTFTRLFQRARRVVARLQPNGPPGERLPRAIREMHAVIDLTDSAANAIMAAAEQIARVDLSDRDRAKTTIARACSQIFEACAFQDITSQRINKVLRTLKFVNCRLAVVQAAWANLSEGNEGTGTSPTDTHDFLAGPALEGEGLDQMQVNRLVG